MAASTSTSTSTAADSNNNSCYDVFISHRAPDVKKTFASHLYRRLISHGLLVFLDYEELQEGEDFHCQIKSAIRTASLHVAIFSPTYADSQWCLDELVLMLESTAPIIPVFHHVKPTELRRTLGEGVYATSLRNLQKKRKSDSQPRYDSKTIEGWRDALSRVADISGLYLEAFNGDEGELLDKVVEVVLKKGKKTQSDVATYLTGLDEKVEDFETKVLLQQHGGTVQVIGITGWGGAGKTTLAKVLFNRKSSKYSKCHFLSDVRENAKKSLLPLQIRLLKGLTEFDQWIDSIDVGIEMLTKHLSVLSSPFLLVIDDVDHEDQVSALLPLTVIPPNSLIWITSRDNNVLARSGVQESSIYKLTGLNTERSRELFCWHAFSQPHPLPGFEYLVNKFLKVVDGLPLSLKIFGALLFGNTDKSYWEDVLEALEKTLPDEIQNRLRISYDTLNREEQQIFLDVACFFIGENRDTAIRVWDGSGWNGSRGFQSLLNKCLVEEDIVEFDDLSVKVETCIRMHDHVKDLGREIAKDYSLRRLWYRTDNIDDLLQQPSVVTKVRGLRMFRSEYKEGDDFSSYKMRNLQLLDSDADLVQCILSVVHSPSLMWLRWVNCPFSSLPPWIPMEKLRVLHVTGLELKTLWQDDLQVPLQLRELQIEAPLSSIPTSIGQLRHLERIIVRRTVREFEVFPEEICDLSSLKHLQLTDFPGLKSLPDSLGNLRNLEHIYLTRCSNLERLPISFGNLMKLKYLDLSYCSNLTLSSGSFGNISTLEYINLKHCDKIVVLPSQIAHQRSLKALYLWHLPNLKEWPGAIGESSVLETPSLKTLHFSPGHDLRNLKYLVLRGCRSLRRLPDSFPLLNQLSRWTVEDCPLQELPFKTVEGESETWTGSGGQGTLSNLDRCLLRLQHLELHNTQISEVSFPTGVCPNLQHLDIRDCQDLVAVGTLPNAIIKLELYGCCKLRKIGEFCSLAKLQMLKISRCEEVHELPSIETLVSLKEFQLSRSLKLKSIEGLAQLTWLRAVDVSGCSELGELSGVENLKWLEILSTCNCVRLNSIPSLAQLTNLRELDVSGCSKLEELPSVEHLTSLEMLQACDCLKLKSIQGLEQLTRLQKLNVSSCSELEEMAGVGHLQSLLVLQASGCLELKSLRGLERLTQLKELDVSHCCELEELPDIKTLVSLKELDASQCMKLKNIQGLAQLTQLEELDVSYCYELEELPCIETLVFLKGLDASQCVKLKSIRGLAQLIQLGELDVSGCSQLEELPGIETLVSLEKFYASQCVKLNNIQGLAQLTQLGELDVSGCSELEQLQGLEHLMSLKVLRASGCVKLKSIRGLEQLIRLQELDVSYCYELDYLPSVEHLWSLDELQASNCVKLKSIQGLAPLRKLRILNVCECYNMEELEGVENLKSLEKLNFSGCPKLRWDWEAVDYPKLQLLRLHSRDARVEVGTLPLTLIILKLNCPNSVKIRGLETLEFLEDLDVSRCVKLKTIRGLALLTKLRTLKVSDCSELEELPGVEHLMSLERVYASGCSKLKKIRGLEKLTKLRELDVCECYGLQKLPGVEHCMSLETLHAFGCPKLHWDAGVVEQLRKRVILTIQ